MLRFLGILVTGILLSLTISDAQAQQVNNYWFTGTPGQYCPPCWVPISTDNPLPVVISGGGGGGVSVTYGGPIGTVGTPGGYKDTSGNFQPFTVGQQVSAASQSVVPASDSAPFPVVGNISSGSTDSGNGVKTAGVYVTSKPALSTGQRGDTQLGQRGSAIIQLAAPDSGSAITFVSGGADTATNAYTAYVQDSRASGFNPATGVWNRFSVDSGTGAVTGAALSVPAPTASATNAITPTIAGSAASSLVAKASAGNLYSAYATCTAACWLMAFNAVSAPADGATTAGVASGNLQDCIPIAAGGIGSLGSNGSPPEPFSVGITLVVSSTACATKTAATTGYIHGSAK